jgi:hypothetical protein
MALRKCIECEYARHTEAEGCVGCAYWSAINPNRDEMFFSMDMAREGQEAFEGWVYLRRRPHTPSDGTVANGLATNFCVIMREDGECMHFRPRENTVDARLAQSFERSVLK